MLKRWNVGLIVASFLLSIFGTFITRSGVIASVHSFTQSSVGYFFLGFLLFVGMASFVLLSRRWPLLEPEARLESLASREAAFLFNNLVLDHKSDWQIYAIFGLMLLGGAGCALKGLYAKR